MIYYAFECYRTFENVVIEQGLCEAKQTSGKCTFPHGYD